LQVNRDSKQYSSIQGSQNGSTGVAQPHLGISTMASAPFKPPSTSLDSRPGSSATLYSQWKPTSGTSSAGMSSSQPSRQTQLTDYASIPAQAFQQMYSAGRMHFILVSAVIKYQIVMTHPSSCATVIECPKLNPTRHILGSETF